jgi:magnesium-transporting ATPase (P-type)
MSGLAVEAAGDVDTLLLDKTGTITLGNRQATEFIALPGVDAAELADAAQIASLSDETPEGRSIVVLARKKYALRAREMAPLNASFVPFGADPNEWHRCRWRLRACSRASPARENHQPPVSAAIAAAVSGLSPVIITVRTPICGNSAKRSRMPPLRMSLR